MTVTVELLEQLVQAAAEAKETVKEAHAARKDLRAAIRDAEELKSDIIGLVKVSADGLVAAEVKRQLDDAGFSRVGDDLRRTLGKWTELLADGEDVLRLLQRHSAVAESLGLTSNPQA